MSETKREVPPALKKLLSFDKEITEKFVLFANGFMPLRSLRTHCKALEITCHGIPWFAFWVAFSWLFGNSSLIPLQVNMLLALFLDIIFVAVSKAYFRRKRPMANTDDALGQVGPDIFSFPSGHASRAVLITYIFTCLYPLGIIFVPPFLAWTVSICISRILMNRHYILDVVGGISLGLFEGCLMSILWISDEHAKWLMTFLSDDKIDGGDYHV